MSRVLYHDPFLTLAFAPWIKGIELGVEIESELAPYRTIDPS